MSIRGLYAIADSGWNPFNNLIELVEHYLRGGVGLIQLRMKEGRDLETAREIAKLRDRWPFTLIINDYVDMAIEVNADGVHVGADDMPVAQVREKLPPHMVVGYSSHSLEEARIAEGEGADYVAFGAIYPTRTKGPGHPVQGIRGLEEVVSALEVPVVAIGGIGRHNISEVMRTGVDAVAMITALCQVPSVTDEVRWFVNRLEV